MCFCMCVSMWACPDKYTQLNSALFSLNASTGYVLQPEMMRFDTYDPNSERRQVKMNVVVRVGLRLTQVTDYIK